MSTQETAPTSYLEADGIRFAYRIIGSRSASAPAYDNGTVTESFRPLVLLNHFRSTIDLWDPYLINNLTANGRQVITYDYAGIGHSQGPVATSMAGFAHNFIAFLNVLLVLLQVKQVDVLGFSIGGFVAQQAVLDAPDLFGNLILSGTGPSLGPDLARPMAEVQSAIMAPIPDGNATVAAFFPGIVADEGLAWIIRGISSRQAVAGKNGEPEFASFLTGPGVANLTKAYLSWDADPAPYSLLQSIQKDVLVTAGQNDLVVPTRNAWIVAHQLPRAVFVQYPTSGHGHIFQYAGKYAKQVVDFLNGEWPMSPFSAGAV